MTRSARDRHSSARTVSSPGSPGPAPTRKTSGEASATGLDLYHLLGLRYIHVQTMRARAELRHPDTQLVESTQGHPQEEAGKGIDSRNDDHRQDDEHEVSDPALA